MNVMVIHASRYGSTREIAEFIAKRLREQGMEAEAKSANSYPDPEQYDAVVIGSAMYLGRWMDEAVQYVRRFRASLAGRPVWLFSSGPLTLKEGVATDDPELEPAELAEIREAVHPRDHRVFFGALFPNRLGIAQRALRRLPAARAVLPEGDFRDWEKIGAWADSIALALRPPEQ